MAFREQAIEVRCQLCQEGGALACERCSIPACPRHHGPDRCKVCEDEFEAAQMERDADVKHLRKLIRNKRYSAPERVRRYNNRVFLVAFAVLVVTSAVALILWGDSLPGILATGGGLGAFFLIWTVVGPWRFRLLNARSRSRQHFLSERKSAAIHRDSGWRVELADATPTKGRLVEERWGLNNKDRIGYSIDDDDEVFVLEGDQRVSSWDQVHAQCVVVTGSLVVDGAIDLRMKEPGGFLAVLGDLNASGVDVWSAEGMSSLYIAGAAKLSGCIVVHHGGTLIVDGDVECRALVSLNDDTVTIGGARSGLLVESNQPASELFDASVLDEYGEIDEDRIESGELSSGDLAEMPRCCDERALGGQFI